MGRIKVSDRAVIAYLEVAVGVDVEGLRRRISRAADAAGDYEGEVRVLACGVGLLVRDGHVVTVEARCDTARRRKRAGRAAAKAAPA